MSGNQQQTGPRIRLNEKASGCNGQFACVLRASQKAYR